MASRNTLTIPELDPDYAVLDGRSMLDRLRFLVHFSKQIHFFDSNNERNGNWSPFLLKDPLIFCAWLSEAKLRQPCSEFLGVSEKLSSYISHLEPDSEGDTVLVMLRQQARHLANLYSELHEWFSIFSMHHSQQAFSISFLDELQSSIVPQLSEFLTIEDYLIKQPPYCNPFTKIDLKMVLDCWMNAGLLKKPTFKQVNGTKNSESLTPEICMNTLNSMHEVVFGFYIRTADRAHKDYQSLLKGYSGYPDTSLLIAYTSLFDNYTKQLNSFTEKHLDFFYRTVLHGSPEDGLPDEAYLILDLLPNVKSIELPKGTQFKGGVYKNKQPILFETVKNETIATCRIKSAISLDYRDKNKLKIKDLSSNVGDVGRKNVIISEHGEGVDLFGDFKSEIQTALIISSPQLCLSSGERNITVALELSSELSIEDFSGFKSFLSTANGLVAVENSVISSKSKNTLNLDITLDSLFPPVIGYLKHNLFKESRWPLLKIDFGDEIDLSRQLLINKISISIEVENAQATLSYDTGTINSAKLAYPFGPVPEMGGSLSIHLPELYVKPLNEINVEFNWNKCPESFSDYYSLYNQHLTGDLPKFDNTVFQVKNYQYLDSSWVKLTEESDSLFKQDENNINLSKTDCKFQFDKPMCCLTSIDDEDTLYQTQQFPRFRLVLESPVQGFGHSLYSSVIAAWTLEQSNPKESENKDKKVKLETPPLPPPLPWSPQTKSINLSYRSTYECDVAKNNGEISVQLYHQDAFSCYEIFDSDKELVPLIYQVGMPVESISNKGEMLPFLHPYFPKLSALYLELNGSESESKIDLYFQMSKISGVTEINDGAIHYYYLSISGWKKFKPLKDDTLNLSISGIVSLILPSDATDHSPLFSNKNHYIAVVNSRPHAKVGNPVLIDSQAIRVKRVLPSGLEAGEIPILNQGSLKSATQKIQGLKKVDQPFSSFGGKAKEGEDEFRHRICHRISHKNRAVTKVDFERICMAIIPDLFFARCITGGEDPSHINIAIVAGSNEGLTVTPPLVSSDILVNTEETLMTKSSLFTEIQVSNMKRQSIGIKAELRFGDGRGSLKDCGMIAAKLRQFMSPWCMPNTETMNLDEGLHRTDLVNLISSQPLVIEVVSLVIEVKRENELVELNEDVLFPDSPDSIFVLDGVVDITNIVSEPLKSELV